MPGFPRALFWEAGRVANLGSNYQDARATASGINDVGDVVGLGISEYEPGSRSCSRRQRTMLGTGFGSGSGASAEASTTRARS